MKIARNSIALDHIWNELCMPEFPISVLKDEWFVEMATGILPDLSGRNHRKVFYPSVEMETENSIRGHNLTDFCGKPRRWGDHKVQQLSSDEIYDYNIQREKWGIILHGKYPADLISESDIFLIYDEHGIIDRLRAITPELILGKFNRPATKFMGYFWLKKNAPMESQYGKYHDYNTDQIDFIFDEAQKISPPKMRATTPSSHRPELTGTRSWRPGTRSWRKRPRSNRIGDNCQCSDTTVPLIRPVPPRSRQSREWPEPPPTKRPKEADSPDTWFPFN